jgi:hypothetical protein
MTIPRSSVAVTGSSSSKDEIDNDGERGGESDAGMGSFEGGFVDNDVIVAEIGFVSVQFEAAMFPSFANPMNIRRNGRSTNGCISIYIRGR